MKLERYPDVDAFLARAGGFLEAREAEHNPMLSLCLSIQAEQWEGGAPYFGAVVRDDRIVLAALRTPPWNLLMSEVDDDAAPSVLAIGLTQADLPGVHGPKEHVKTFADTWSSLTGRANRLHMAQRLFRLTTVRTPRPAMGVFRLAASRDRDLLINWQAEFGREALGETDTSRIPSWVDRRLSGEGGLIYIWEDGNPVSCCGVGGRTPHGVRMGSVYTPPELRGRGYASNCVAAASRAQLDAGRRYCVLFTDLANPTSNHIYQEIGYEPVRDVEVYNFDPPISGS